MSDKQYDLYRTIQLDAGAVSYDLRKIKTEIETTTPDSQTLSKLCDCMITTADELALLISKTAQLIFNK